MIYLKFLISLFSIYMTGCGSNESENLSATDRVLVFSKTEGFRHSSIPVGVAMLMSLGQQHNFEVSHTEDASQFNDVNLAAYDLVIFLSTTGDVLNIGQEAAFKKYIENGGSYLGIHAAADTEFDWSWYGELTGAYFVDHPKTQEATIIRIDDAHPSTSMLPEHWERTDEWYNYKEIQDGIQVLLKLDESSYKGGKNGGDHPIAWCRDFDGGRMFYTGLGHTEESYSEPLFREHILGGIEYCLHR
ncbi:ThuA domain-containing protein [Robertkochia solimangrovi]|uniref:ThuA domain-containing protein n=1 Tax=Robertkochia solimangrovi TaxID=2213046 RepID=UPI00117E23F4|nr:ThuA domain-containing protein [Robertkochia solimangrovi]TRZ45949.1 ThuA domain-containing protein [Robertkochia solimangrovi]